LCKAAWGGRDAPRQAPNRTDEAQTMSRYTEDYLVEQPVIQLMQQCNWRSRRC
jgi:hypothetical protein